MRQRVDWKPISCQDSYPLYIRSGSILSTGIEMGYKITL